MLPTSMPQGSPMGGAGGAPPGMGMAGGAGAPGGGAGQPSADEVRQMLSEVLKQAKQLADQYGIDLVSLIPTGGGAGAPGGGIPPIPPGASAGTPPMM